MSSSSRGCSRRASSDREHLRKEIELARKAEARMRAAVVESERRADAAVQNLNFESPRLQGALDRANGERTRLAYELASLKRQTTDSQAA